MKKARMKKKKAVSLMISYVILVSIAVALGAGTYAWLKDYANIAPKVNCKDGTSARLESYKCVNNIINLSVKNNGYFNIDGIIVQGSSDLLKSPTQLLKTTAEAGNYFPEGNFYFRKYKDNEGALKPGEIKDAKFFIEADLKIIQIQPFIWDEKGYKIVCEDTLIKQNLENCMHL